MASKGLALTSVMMIIIAVFSLVVLLLFFSEPVEQILTNTFCFFNNNVFSVFGMNLAAKLCKPVECGADRKVITPLSKQDFINQIAAYTLMCWKEKSPACGKTAICYELVVKDNPLLKTGEIITEYDLTKTLEEQGACHILENANITTEYGQRIPYSGECGDEDLLIWQIENNVIWDQSLILIKYDILNNKIWVVG